MHRNLKQKSNSKRKYILRLREQTQLLCRNSNDDLNCKLRLLAKFGTLSFRILCFKPRMQNLLPAENSIPLRQIHQFPEAVVECRIANLGVCTYV